MLEGRYRPASSAKSVSPLRLQQSQPLLLSAKMPNLRASQYSFRSGSEAGSKATEMTAANVQLELHVAELSNQVQELQQALRRSADLEESFRKELREKVRHVGELKGIVADYERKMQMYMSAEPSGDLASRSEELQSQLEAKDSALRESSRLIQQLLERNKELEAKHSRDHSFRLQSENRHLKEQLAAVTQSYVRKSDHEALLHKCSSLEANQSKAQEIALRYQQRLNAINRSGVMSSSEQFLSVAEELTRLHTDISQITAALGMVHENKEVDLGLLLSLSPALLQLDGESPGVACSKALERIKSEVARLRALVSDFFAEYCGQGCTQH